MHTQKQPRGRPAKHGAPMLKPITIRLPEPMMDRIEELMHDRLDGPDKSSIIRELIAKALKDVGA